MQGWFAYNFDFLPTNDLRPVFVGTHFREEAQKFLKHFFYHFPHYFKDKSIGCRDLYTLEFLQRYKLDAYFSRCLTLTLDKREKGEYKKVFFVGINENLKEYFPPYLLENSEFINQTIVNHNDSSWEYMYENTKNLLDRYKNEARLVICSALHCAAPCVAMGINVILIQITNEQGLRFSALNGILPIYSVDDLKQGNINFECNTPDIENLKVLMLENLKLSILQTWGEKVDEEKLKNTRKEISNFKL
ncbi:polysaccharide pyruvyl transferase family protein [Campylobacter sp. LR185c]|uniref:polysaccharide pyruvyl transferase family protein n=2 Tax=Campylobacter TaxID=194 RepID=UPI001237B4E1|nr:polysaccharide pyruvyl transferase family protein [Campylobacter sp. LR185c]KAA6226122.1 polysaccharide pyruvyl transferase family protein [Campylobacter sp. LR185c]KAA8604620.1 glycosyl transferase [Campylobacter sp. LR185c]